MENKPMTHSEFAQKLGLSRTTLWRRLKLHNLQMGRDLLTPKEQQEIRQKLGYLEEPTRSC
jgi:predicted DNA-binding protein (UPF0251 family)